MMRYFLTGISGSLSEALIELILKDHRNSVVGISRNEYLQWRLKRKYPKVDFILSDVCNPENYLRHLDGVDIIIHTAALKHVETKNIYEYDRINVGGTRELFSVRPDIRKVLISTDKASQPESFYGYTKAMAEAIALHEGQRVIRLGNFTSSHGNITELFKDSDPPCYCSGMTRFFMPTLEVAQFVLDRCFEDNWRGICIPKMKTATLKDVFDAYYKPIEETKVFRDGEKMHETLVSQSDRPVWDMDGWYFIGEREKGFMKMPKGFTYKSNNNKDRWTVGEIMHWEG